MCVIFLLFRGIMFLKKLCEKLLSDKMEDKGFYLFIERIFCLWLICWFFFRVVVLNYVLGMWERNLCNLISDLFCEWKE